MNQKGLMDVIYILTFIFGAAIIFISVTMIMNEMDSSMEEFFQDADSSVPNDTWNEAVEVTENFDILVLGAFIALIVMALILAAVIPANPVFIPVYLMLAFVAVIIAVPISNTFEDFSAESSFQSIVTNHYPIATFIFQNLPIIIVVIIAMMMIVTYAKGGSGYGP